MKITLIGSLFFVFLNLGSACKPRSASGGSEIRGGAGQPGQPFACTFEIPDGSGDSFAVSGTPSASTLVNVQSTIKFAGKSEQKTLANAPAAPQDVLIDKWDKKLEDQKSTDREINAYGKDKFLLDQNNYTCFDISGAGPKKEDYFCLHKTMQVGAAQALWISDFHYATDLNVLNVMGSNCLQVNR